MKMQDSCKLPPVRFAVMTALCLAGTGVQASGFAVPEISIAGIGLSNALVANTTDVGALPYNPAAMAFLSKASVGGGVLIINPNNTVSDTLGNPGQEFDTVTSDWLGIVMGYGHMRIDDNLSVGLSVNTPFGLETKWPSAAFAKGFAPSGLEPTHSKLALISASPSLTYKINGKAAVSGGFDVYWITDVKLNSTSAVICCGDGTGAGFHLAGLYRSGPWSFGASYFSSSRVDIEDGRFEAFGRELGVNTEVEVPWRAQIGAGYQVTDAVNVEFDIARTGWSSFDKLEVYASDPFVNASLGGHPLATSVNDWEDANAYRLGVTWDLSDATRLRLGYSYDETPQDDDRFNPRIPDADRHLFSIGIRQKLADGWELEGGYMYVTWNDRSINQPPPSGLGAGPNGTALYNGDYEGHSHLLGLGLSKRF